MKTKILFPALILLFVLAAFILNGCMKEEIPYIEDPKTDLGFKIVDKSYISYDDYMNELKDRYRDALPDPQVANDFRVMESSISKFKSENHTNDSEWWSKYFIVKWKVEYDSHGPDGSPIRLTGAIFMNVIDYFTNSKQNGIIIANHFTIGSNAETPSESYPIEAHLCFMEYLVVMADYYGFNKTSGLPQAYLHAGSTAQAVVDLALIAKKVVAENGVNKIGNTWINLGYSQGGHTAMAVHKLIQENYSDKIKLSKTIAGGGPYDLRVIYDNFVKTDHTGIPAGIPLIVLGMNHAERLQLDMSKMFLEPLKSNYTEWCVSKKYDIAQITQKMGGDNIPVSKILTQEALNTNDPNTKKLLNALDKSTLTKGWKPKNASSIYIYHSTKDDVVPVECSRNMVSFIERETGEHPDINITDKGNHGKAGISFYTSFVKDKILQ